MFFFSSFCMSFFHIIWAPSSEFVSSSIPSWQISTAHVHPFRGARDLVFCLKVPLDSLLVWASSEGSGETARMRRLAWTFAARIGDKYQIRLTRSILSFFCNCYTQSKLNVNVWCFPKTRAPLWKCCCFFDFETMSTELLHIHYLWVLLIHYVKNVLFLKICRVTTLAFQNNISAISELKNNNGLHDHLPMKISREIHFWYLMVYVISYGIFHFSYLIFKTFIIYHVCT